MAGAPYFEIERLPIELFCLVLEQLEHNQVIKARQVCRGWKHIIDSAGWTFRRMVWLSKSHGTQSLPDSPLERLPRLTTFLRSLLLDVTLADTDSVSKIFDHCPRLTSFFLQKVSQGPGIFAQFCELLIKKKVCSVELVEISWTQVHSFLKIVPQLTTLEDLTLHIEEATIEEGDLAESFFGLDLPVIPYPPGFTLPDLRKLCIEFHMWEDESFIDTYMSEPLIRLLCSLSSLEHLKIENLVYSSESYSHAIALVSANNKALRTVELQHIGLSTYIFPNVENLTLTNCRNDAVTTSEAERHTSKLKELFIEYTELGPDDHLVTLPFSPHLQTFSVKDESGGTAMDFIRILRGLEHPLLTLQTLVLDMRHDWLEEATVINNGFDSHLSELWTENDFALLIHQFPNLYHLQITSYMNICSVEATADVLRRGLKFLSFLKLNRLAPAPCARVINLDCMDTQVIWSHSGPRQVVRANEDQR